MNQKLRHFCDGTNTMLIKFEIEMNLLLFVLWVKQKRSLERARALVRKKMPGAMELICTVKINNQQSEPFQDFNSLEWWWSRQGENALFALAPFHRSMLSSKFCYSRIMSIDSTLDIDCFLNFVSFKWIREKFMVVKRFVCIWNSI